MTPRQQLLQQYLENQQSAIGDLHKLGYTFLEPNEIWTILIAAFDVEVYTDVLYLGLSVEDIVNVVAGIVESSGSYCGRVELYINESQVDWLLRDNSKLSKAIIKVDNVQWAIHQNDADPFPSMPHAHDYTHNLVLSLETGELFRNRQLTGKLRPKEFVRVREIIQRKLPGIKLP